MTVSKEVVDALLLMSVFFSLTSLAVAGKNDFFSYMHISAGFKLAVCFQFIGIVLGALYIFLGLASLFMVLLENTLREVGKAYLILTTVAILFLDLLALTVCTKDSSEEEAELHNLRRYRSLLAVSSLFDAAVLAITVSVGVDSSGGSRNSQLRNR